MIELLNTMFLEDPVRRKAAVAMRCLREAEEEIALLRVQNARLKELLENCLAQYGEQ